MPFLLASRRRPTRPLTRFAPAPTGYLHLGHAASAVWVWGVARALGGTGCCSVSRTTIVAFSADYEHALLEDLEWLGLEPDLGHPAEYRAGSCAFRQSERGPVYERELARLAADGLAFACDCSRRRLRESGSASPERGDPL